MEYRFEYLILFAVSFNMFDRRNVYVIGDSNLREVVGTEMMKDLETNVTPGLSFYSPQHGPWGSKVKTPLQCRMSRSPPIKVLVVHFGTCDSKKSPGEFSEGVREFTNIVHMKDNSVKIIFSEVLPRNPAYIKYNEVGQAHEFNKLRQHFNKTLTDFTEKTMNCYLVKHDQLDGMNKQFFKDSVHLSSGGALILARNLNAAIENVIEEANVDHAEQLQREESKRVSEYQYEEDLNKHLANTRYNFFFKYL